MTTSPMRLSCDAHPLQHPDLYPRLHAAVTAVSTRLRLSKTHLVCRRLEGGVDGILRVLPTAPAAPVPMANPAPASPSPSPSHGDGDASDAQTAIAGWDRTVWPARQGDRWGQLRPQAQPHLWWLPTELTTGTPPYARCCAPPSTCPGRPQTGPQHDGGGAR